MVTWVIPFVPLLGVVSGGFTVGQHMWSKKTTEPKVSKEDVQEEER